MKYLVIFLLMSPLWAFSQLINEKKEKYPSEFAILGRFLVENNFVGPQEYLTQNDSLYARLGVSNGFAIGGILRKNFEERFALEYGLIYTSRKFEGEMGFIDQDLNYRSDFRFITYSLPVTALVFVKLSPEIYANVGFGLAGTYKASNVEVVGNPDGDHVFHIGGLARPKFGLDMNGQFGFEYRTRNSGTFYIGSTMRLGLAPIFYNLNTYRNEGNADQLIQEVKSSSMSLELRWYLPHVQNRGEQTRQGPIVQ